MALLDTRAEVTLIHGNLPHYPKTTVMNVQKIRVRMWLPPHLNTEHDITRYRISHSIGWLGQRNQLVVKINSIAAEPRTTSQA